MVDNCWLLVLLMLKRMAYELADEYESTYSKESLGIYVSRLFHTSAPTANDCLQSPAIYSGLDDRGSVRSLAIDR